jgi:hypothetical protein
MRGAKTGIDFCLLREKTLLDQGMALASRPFSSTPFAPLA